MNRYKTLDEGDTTTDDIKLFEEYLRPSRSEQFDAAQDAARPQAAPTAPPDDLSRLYEEFLRSQQGDLSMSRQNQMDLEERRKREGGHELLLNAIGGAGKIIGTGIGTALGGDLAGLQAAGMPSQDFSGAFTQHTDRDIALERDRQQQGMDASRELMGMEQLRRTQGIEDERLGRERESFGQQMRAGDQSFELGEMQIDRLVVEMNDEQALRDPNSEISQQYRDIAEAAGLDVTGNENAFQLGQSFPMLAQAAQMDLQRQAQALSQAQFGESKSQFDRQMAFSIDKANQQAMQAEMARLEAMGAQEQEAEILKWDTASKVVEPLERNPEFRANKEDLNNIIRLSALVEPSSNNVQVAMKLVQGYESLLRNSARPNEIAEASGRGVGWLQQKKEDLNAMLGSGNVPTKVIKDIEEALAIISEGTVENIVRMQEPYMSALMDRGIDSRYARQYFVTQETLESAFSMGGE